MSENILLLYASRSDTATLSGGGWESSLPLSNLKKPELYEIARTIDVDPDNTKFRVDMVASYPAKAICLGPSNFSTGYSYRIRGYEDVGLLSMVVDTGWVGGSERAEWNTLNWSDPAFWTGAIPWSDPDRGQWIIHIFPSVVTAQYWTIEIDDQDNPAGHLSIGRLFMGLHWQPKFASYGPNNGLRFVDNSLKSETLSGSKVIHRRVNPRVFTFSFDYLPDEEVFSKGYEFQRDVGYDGEVFVIPEPGDTRWIHRRSFLCRATVMNAMSQVIHGYSSIGFELEEIL